ncbi:MAG: MarR family winged helix-turn-helix transcriptional regulator [Nocardioidaceae bacterium]
MVESASTSHAGLVEEIVGSLARRHSTATVLFHHAIAERLGLGPTDHKCLDLLHERGSMSGSELAAITGLTSGAVTGVVSRLERAGHVRREPDPHDGRKQILRLAPEGAREVAELFDRLRDDAAELVEGFDDHQLAAIAEFLTRGVEFAYHRTALLRTQAVSAGGHTRAATTTATTTKEPS